MQTVALYEACLLHSLIVKDTDKDGVPDKIEKELFGTAVNSSQRKIEVGLWKIVSRTYPYYTNWILRIKISDDRPSSGGIITIKIYYASNTIKILTFNIQWQPKKEQYYELQYTIRESVKMVTVQIKLTEYSLDWHQCVTQLTSSFPSDLMSILNTSDYPRRWDFDISAPIPGGVV